LKSNAQSKNISLDAIRLWFSIHFVREACTIGSFHFFKRFASRIDSSGLIFVLAAEDQYLSAAGTIH
jgi:hypothetical protein